MKKFFEPALNFSNLQCQRNDTVPYLKLQLSSLISHSGHQGDFMIPVKVLADRLKIAPQTLHKVYDLLENEGSLFRQPGKRQWQLNVSSRPVPCLGLILSAPFSIYFAQATSYGQCHFRMYSGLMDRASELGYTVFPLQLPPPDAGRNESLQALLKIRERCQGVIHLGDRGCCKDHPLQIVSECDDLPQISFNSVFRNPRIGSVTFDEELAIHLFTDTMKELGHQHFAFIFIKSPSDNSQMLDYSLASPRKILHMFAREGVDEHHLHIIGHNRKIWEQYRNTISRLISGDNPPTAFLCRNDDIALELIQIIRSCGFRVPEDFSVMGFNNLNDAEFSDPPLSTLANPLVKLGAALADLLHHRIQHPEETHPGHIRIPPQLILRSSTGPCTSNFLY